jgi:hypothetical protein
VREMWWGRPDSNPRPPVLRIVALAVVMLIGGAACSQPPPPGTQPTTVQIKNLSAAPITLAIQLPTGVLPGAAQPESVPAGATREVILYLPPGGDWELTVNGTGWMPGRDFADYRLPGCRVAMEINIDGSGSFGCSAR